MRRLLTGLLALALLAGACGDDDGDDRAAVTSIPDDPPTTSSTTTEPPVPPIDVIPQDVSLITEEYVERVLDALFEVSLETLLSIREEGLVGQEAIALVEATHSDAVAVREINDLIEAAFAEIGNLRSDPEPMDITVVELLATATDCVVAEVRTDASRLVTTPPPAEPNERDFVRLFPATEDQRASRSNPSAWVIDEFPVTLDGSVPGLTCP